MTEETLLRYCSPTLAGIKTGSLFQYRVDSEDLLIEDMKKWNRFLCGKGLRMQSMSYHAGRALVYVYRPNRLKADLDDCMARKLLKNAGYCCDKPETCICKLIHKLKSSENFPHEIGLFLGYPPEDVHGFIENNAKDYKWSGLWKVYGDVNVAKKKHRQYEKCTCVYLDKWQEGLPLERLTVQA